MFKLDAATQPSSARKVRTRPVDTRRSEMPEEVGEDHDVEASIPEQLLIDKVLGISDDHSSQYARARYRPSSRITRS
jgi:hypothetical protein